MTDWHIEGEWFKNCNCDPGCPCDFNQRPTKGFCQGMAAMRITKGQFGEVALTGVTWGAIVRWPGALHEGNGEMQPFVDSKASEEQVGAIFELASGKHGDTFMEVFSFPLTHRLQSLLRECLSPLRRARRATVAVATSRPPMGRRP